jgi:hypothetical protein
LLSVLVVWKIYQPGFRIPDHDDTWRRSNTAITGRYRRYLHRHAQSYLLAAVCFAFLAFLALKLKGVLKAQGLDFDEQVSAGINYLF